MCIVSANIVDKMSQVRLCSKVGGTCLIQLISVFLVVSSFIYSKRFLLTLHHSK